jgi:hypothetical protein
MSAHLSWLGILVLTAPLTWRFDFLTGFIAALERLPDILRLRARERVAAIVSDRDVLRIFRLLGGREYVTVYDQPEDLFARTP